MTDTAPEAAVCFFNGCHGPDYEGERTGWYWWDDSNPTPTVLNGPFPGVVVCANAARKEGYRVEGIR